MNILGLSFMYHDSAAALIKDGIVIAAAAEERFSRKKHSLDFPGKACAYCLQEGGISIDEVDYIVFYEKPLLKFERIMMMHLEHYPRGLSQFCTAMPLWFKYKLFIKQMIRKALNYKKKILFVDHHYAHAASSFFASGFERAAILTADGVGEWATLTKGSGNGNQIELTHELRYPHSLGLLYSTITAFLGFKVNGGEGKVMGLAAYGVPVYFDDMMKELIDVKPDGSFMLNMDYFGYHYEMVMFNKKFIARYGQPRVPESEITARDKDLAASLQKVVETVCVLCAQQLYRETALPNICIAGGVGLNTLTNGRILKESGFKNIFIQPASGDDGGALGAALFVYHQYLGNERRWNMQNAYLGPSNDAKQVRAYLDARHVSYQEYGELSQLIDRVAQDLQAGKIIGWVQGRMEYGPRALGDRSIIANPLIADMQDTLNNKVKHREPFRPFAPVVPLEHCREYFDLDVESPYMLLVSDVLPEKRKLLPSITHVDGTARVQTVTKAQNERLYALTVRFGELTRTPVLLNTSFNVRGEPIVCDHADAFKCFLSTDMDVLVIDDIYISKVTYKGAAHA